MAVLQLQNVLFYTIADKQDYTLENLFMDLDIYLQGTASHNSVDYQGAHAFSEIKVRPSCQ